LDKIVAKALEKDPTRRYATADAFAEDLTRYLNHLPVSARRATWVYRTGKFVRRYRGAVVVGVVAWLLLIAAAVITAWQARTAQVQRDIARSEMERANAQSEFQNLLLSEVGNRPMTMGEILDRGRYLVLHQSAGDLRFLPSLLVDLSGHYGEIGGREVRDTLLKTADSIARALREPGLIAQVQCDRADNLRTEGKYDEARAALNATDSLLARETNPRVTVRCLQIRGDLEAEAGPAKQATVDYRRALAIKARLGETRDGTYFDVLGGLAGALNRVDQPREAIAFFNQAIGGMDSTGRGGMITRVIMQHNAALVLVKLGEIAEGERRLHDVLVRAERADPNGRIDWQPLIHYAETALIQGDADSASKYFTMIVTRANAEAQLFWQGRGLFGLARAEIASGQTARARVTAALFAKVARAYPKVKLTDDLVPDTTILAGLVSLAERRTAAAQASFLEALRVNGYFEGKRWYRLRPVALRVSETALELGQPGMSLEYARAVDSSATLDSLTGQRSGWVGQAKLLEARAQLAAGDTAAARTAATAAARALKVGLGSEHPLTLSAQSLVAFLRGGTR
jgi:serine/threonine-protein kinase